MKAKQVSGWSLENIGFAALVVAVTLLFAWMLTPYFGAILWGLVAAIVFRPLYLWLAVRLGGRQGLAAGITLVLIVAVVIVPAALLGASLVSEASSLYARVQNGELDLGAMLAKASHALHWTSRRLGTGVRAYRPGSPARAHRAEPFDRPEDGGGTGAVRGAGRAVVYRGAGHHAVSDLLSAA
ncbi:hypothetical protein OKA06_12305 [Novosphingobium sp. MW5]|nr:hypothetical protein [Novosphingobium sp. MW5]